MKLKSARNQCIKKIADTIKPAVFLISIAVIIVILANGWEARQKVISNTEKFNQWWEETREISTDDETFDEYKNDILPKYTDIKRKMKFLSEELKTASSQREQEKIQKELGDVEEQLAGLKVMQVTVNQDKLVKLIQSNPEMVKDRLAGVHLQYSDLRGTDLNNANLQGANLKGADLLNVSFDGANLQLVNLLHVRNLTVEQLAKAKTLHQASLDPPLKAEIEKLYPDLLRQPAEPTFQ